MTHYITRHGLIPSSNRFSDSSMVTTMDIDNSPSASAGHMLRGPAQRHPRPGVEVLLQRLFRPEGDCSYFYVGFYFVMEHT